jgi:hypothetical protein
MCMAEAMCHVAVAWLWWLVGHAVTCTCVLPLLELIAHRCNPRQCLHCGILGNFQEYEEVLEGWSRT